MKHWTILLIGFFTLFGIGLTASAAPAHEHRLSGPVAFGRGLNTTGPGNKLNHAIVPQKITVDQGGVVPWAVGDQFPLHQCSVGQAHSIASFQHGVLEPRPTRMSPDASCEPGCRLSTPA